MVSTLEETRSSEPEIAVREFASIRPSWIRLTGRLPILPLAILVPFVLIAVFANYIAPYDPTEPIPGAKIFEPPFWMEGGNSARLARN